MDSFTGKLAVVTGGGSGMGRLSRTCAPMRPVSGSPSYYQRPRCTTSPNGRRLGLRIGASGRSAG